MRFSNENASLFYTYYSLLVIILLSLIKNVYGGELLEYKSLTNSECSRRCDTKFSNADCWREPFVFFTNDFMLNYLNFLKTALILADNENGASIYLNHEIFKNESLLNEFLGPFQDNEIVEFSETMKSIYNLIVNEYERLLFQNKKKMSINQSFRLDCPKSNCFETKDTYLQRKNTQDTKITALKVLTVFFLSASCLLIIVYLFIYLYIESRLEKSYKKL